MANIAYVRVSTVEQNEQRQREGIAIAKAQGKFKGRKEISVPNFEQHYDRYLQRDVSKAQLAKELDVSRPTLDKLIKGMERRI